MPTTRVAVICSGPTAGQSEPEKYLKYLESHVQCQMSPAGIVCQIWLNEVRGWKYKTFYVNTCSISLIIFFKINISNCQQIRFFV